MENKEVIELLEGASSKIKSIVPKSPAGASLKNQSAEKIDKAISLLKQPPTLKDRPNFVAATGVKSQPCPACQSKDDVAEFVEKEKPCQVCGRIKKDRDLDKKFCPDCTGEAAELVRRMHYYLGREPKTARHILEHLLIEAADLIERQAKKYEKLVEFSAEIEKAYVQYYKENKSLKAEIKRLQAQLKEKP